MLANFKIVLVETSHPGNIGAVARAMKNMGLYDLALVNPKFFPHADATSRASGAHDILAQAQLHSCLSSALSESHLVLGASARDRTINWPLMSARECAEKFVREPAYQKKNIALVFGRENSGLTNQELDLCHYLLRIPCNPEFSSLNLAAAVQVVSYELFQARQSKPYDAIEIPEDKPVTMEQMDQFYQHLHQTLVDIDFMHKDKSNSIMRRLRKIFNRIELENKELDILRGILRFSQNHNQK